ncbi:MAG: isochorismatase family protein [Acidobacteriota bacterium]
MFHADEVYVAGLTTDVCVRATALDAIELGYKTCVVADACRSTELQTGAAEAAIAQMRRAGARILSSESP